MAPRRRFFPSTTAQKVPGRTVELETQLRRCPAAAASVNEVGWFSPIFDGWWAWHWDELPDGRWEVNESNGRILSIWEGDPQGMELPVPTSTFRCVEITARYGIVGGNSTHHVGVVQGSTMSDVRWEAAWDAPSVGDPTVSAGIGNRFWTWGNVIVVEQLRKGDAGGPVGTGWKETLTATAFSGGTEVGTLVFIAPHGVLTHEKDG